MHRKGFPKKTGISAKVAITNIVLIASAFLWYFHAFNFLRQTIEELVLPTSEALLVWGVNFAVIAGSAFLGAILVGKFSSRKPFLFYWMACGIVVSLAPLILDLTEIVGLTTISAIFGGYFGLGMPACMGYFSASTDTEHRSRVGGVTFLCVGLGFFLIGGIGSNDVATNAFILVAIRAISLLSLLLLKVNDSPIEKEGKVSYTFILTNKPFLLYFIPWCMFSLINYMAIPVISKIPTTGNISGEEFVRNSMIIESILTGIFAVVGGFFADYFGRKRLAIVGFAMLGVGYAILGFSPENVSSWYFYTVVDGVAWGSFYTIFLFTLWGDLSREHNSEKYYVIGGLPYLASNFIRVWVGSYIGDFVELSSVFSFAAFFLFLAVLPLAYAPETLPEKIMKDRELKSYIEKAQKEATKVQKT